MGKVFSRVLLQLLICLVITFSGTGAFAVTTGFISAPYRMDMVYDDARGILYITNASSVLRYRMDTESFLTPYNFGAGSLTGIDLSPDGKTLAIADKNIHGIHLVDLESDTVLPDVTFAPDFGEAGTHSVAFGADGAVLVSAKYNGSGWVPLRRVDPATRAVTVIEGDIRMNSMLSASADGKCIAFEESNTSNGPVHLYDVATQQIVATANTDEFNYEIAVNRDCTQVAALAYGDTFIYDNEMTKLGAIGAYPAGHALGAAYNPVTDIVYFSWAGTNRVRAYDTRTFTQLAAFDMGYVFDDLENWAYDEGRLKVSRDGSLLFATVGSGIRYVRASVSPVAEDQSVSVKSTGGSITLTGSSPGELPLSYTVLTQPEHGTLSGSAPNLNYTPDPGYSGLDSFTFDVSDGMLASPPATVTIAIDGAAPVIDSFTLAASSTTLTVPLTLSASDNIGVAGYCLSQSTSAASCTWQAAPPTSYRFATIGSKTLYAFARDAAGNVSNRASAVTVIPEIVPRITAFSMPARYGYDNLTVPLTLSASDDLAVTGYCLRESADPAGCDWRGWAPSSYTFASLGPHTLYAFARNSSGKISPPVSASTSVVGQVNFIPAAGRTDLVYDSARDLVYITDGPSVLRYRLATQTFLAPFTFGAGSLTGIDLSPDGKTLAVADKNINGVHLIDLVSSTVKPDVNFTAGTGEAGTHSVAFGADGALLVSAKVNGSGWVPLRRVDPATGAVTVVRESVRQDTMLSASADGQCIAYEESNISSGPIGIYRVATQSVSNTASSAMFTYEIASNRDCSQFAVPTYGGTMVYDHSLNKIGTVGSYAAAQPLGAAYSPVSDLVYFAWIGSAEVRAYDSTTWQQTASFDFGHTFSHGGNHAYESGRLKVARDGSLLFGTVAKGVRYQRVGGAAPAADNQAVVTYLGTPLPITLTGTSPAQAALSYSVTTPPAHGSLQGTAPHLIYTPDPGYSGVDSIVFKVSDGSLESNSATMKITVRPVASGVQVLPPEVKGQLTLSWVKPADPGFSHIRIYRSTTAGTPGARIADNLTGTGYTDTGLASDSVYFYTVRWVDGAGVESNDTTQVSGRTLDATAPVTTATPAPGSYRSAQQVTLSCNDHGGSGCAATYYCLGSGCTPATLYNNQGIALTGSETLRFSSVDQADNSEPLQSAAYTIEPRYITATPSSLNLGAALLHYPTSETVTIANAGSLPLSVTASTLTGPDSGRFSVAPGGTAPCSSVTPTLAPQQSCTLTVTLTADAAGAVYAYLQIASNADNAATLSVPLTGIGLPPVYLTTLISGNGTVNNIEPASTFSCAAPNCIAPFAAGSTVTLRATPAAPHAFMGWSGGGCSGVNDCVINLIANTTVTAQFAEQPLVRVNGSAAIYRRFSDALIDVLATATIASRNVTISDNIELQRPLNISIVGGLREDFATSEGVTVVDGKITIRQGTLRVRGVAVR